MRLDYKYYHDASQRKIRPRVLRIEFYSIDFHIFRKSGQ